MPYADHRFSGVSNVPLNTRDLDATNPAADYAHLHATLQQIDQLANEDVDMQGPPLEELTYIVLDTNILLHHFEVVQQFVDDIEAQSLSVIVVIPGAVIYELDGQKNRDGLAWFARRASAWLLKKVRERKSVKGQAQEETCKPSGNWKIRAPGEDFGSERANDFLICDCCLYFQRVRGKRTFICSADINLCLDCESADVPAIQPARRQWSSKKLATAIFGHVIDESKFCGYQESYHFRTASSTQDEARNDDDGMDVDDDNSWGHVHNPSHPLDLLHRQVIEHFTRLLVELVARVGGPEIYRKSGDGAVLSRYAPRYAQKDLKEWTARDCLEYLDTKKHQTEINPRLGNFLTMPYVKERGWRRGQDWSSKDWEISLSALGTLGEAWEEGSIRESLRGLAPHVYSAFTQRMRPTGI